MKVKVDRKYSKICIYAALTCMAIYLFTVVVDYAFEILGTAFNILSGIMDILNPIIIAMIISYLLYGPMNTIEKFLLKRRPFKDKKGLCRGIGVAGSYILIFSIILGIIFGIYLMIGGQISNSSTFANIFDTIDEYFENNSLSTDSFKELLSKWNLPFSDFISDKADSLADFLSDSITLILSGVGDAILDIGGNILSFIVSTVLSIYLLISYEYFLNLFDKIFFLIFRKSKVGKDVRHSLQIINYTFSNYIHGQLIEAFLVFVLSSIALTIVGIDYSLVIGIICGVCNLIPYVGPFVGIVFAAIMALFSGDLWSLVWAVVALFIVQQIDCNILCPNIVGDIVGLNAAFTLIALSIGGDLAGLLGILIAVPVAACIKQLCDSWFNKKMATEYIEYTDTLHKELEQYSLPKAKKDNKGFFDRFKGIQSNKTSDNENSVENNSNDNN